MLRVRIISLFLVILLLESSAFLSKNGKCYRNGGYLARYTCLNVATTETDASDVFSAIDAPIVKKNLNRAVKSQVVGEEEPKAKKVKKEKPPKITAKQTTGLIYSDKDGEYDVPILDTHRWYRINVRKNSEKRLCETFLSLGAEEERWRGVVVDAHYPFSSYVRLKGSALSVATKPLIAGLLYIKTKMNPDIADDIEKMQGVYGFAKGFGRSFVEPLTEEQGQQLEALKVKAAYEIDPAQANIRKDEYVSVVSGPHAGRYGILMGSRLGRLEVCLRSEYKDDWELFDVTQLRHLPDPPEKNWQEMTAKEAVESLMAKDPHNPTIKNLKKQGLLNEILYPGRQSRDDSRFGPRSMPQELDSRFQGGREGGKRVRSIALDRDPPARNPQDRAAGGRDQEAAWTPTTTSSGGAMSDRDLDSILQGLLADSFKQGAPSGPPSIRQPQQQTQAQQSGFDTPKRYERRGAMEAVGEERALDDLLSDLDIPPAATTAAVEKRWKKVAAPAATLSDLDDADASSPKIEDFDSFEHYLDALVSHEKGAGGGGRASQRTSLPPAASRPGPRTPPPALADDDWLASLDDSLSRSAPPRPASPLSFEAPRAPATPSAPAAGAVEEKRWKRPDKPASLPPLPPLPPANTPSKTPAKTSRLDVDVDDLESFLNSLEDEDFSFAADIDELLSDRPRAAPAPAKAVPPTPVPAPVAASSNFAAPSPAKGTVQAKNTASPTPTGAGASAGVGAEDAVPRVRRESELDALTVKELKDVLRGQGLPMTGKKADMIARLLSADSHTNE